MNFEYWLGGFYPEGSAQFIAYSAAVEELEREIARLDPDPEMLDWIRLDGRRGWIEVCHHKAFRRFDIQISSIGAGEWRGAIPLRGTDGLERAETLERYLQPIEGWIGGTRTDQKLPDDELYRSIQELLGDRDDEKIFLASLLVSLLRPQQITAKKRAEKRVVLDM